MAAKSLLSMMTVGGHSLHGVDRYDVINPSTGTAFATAPACSATQLDDAIESAQKAWRNWSLAELNRRNCLKASAEEIAKHKEDLATLITLEQGKPIAESHSEIDYAVSVFESYAKMPIPCNELSVDSETRTLLLHRSIGVVGILTPWNFPIGTAAVKIAPALLAGNTIVLKPSPVAPLAALLLARILRSTLPAGVFNAISGGSELGHIIASDPRIRKVSLTGSTRTGKEVLKAAADTIKSTTLELGGNDPAIILPDADVQTVAPALLSAAWRNAGQVCSAIKRIYVHRTLYRNLLQALTAEMDRYKVGDGFAKGTLVGPLTTDTQIANLQRLSSQALDAGATFTSTEKDLPDKGYYFAPAIVTDLDAEDPLIMEEQFGPLLPVTPYSTIEEAIEWTNRSDYGLSASIWTSHPNFGYEIAAQIECGRVGINGHRRAEADAPFGGFKQSGNGRELGVWGLLEMCEPQVVNIFSRP